MGGNSRLCFSLPTVAQMASAVARPMCSCEREDEKASSLTLRDKLQHKPAKGKRERERETTDWHCQWDGLPQVAEEV